MRKFYLAIRVFLICGVLAGSATLYALARNDVALDAESKTFVQDTIATIGARWDADALWSRATAHFREQTKPEDLHALFDAAGGSLGQLVEYQAIHGKATFTFAKDGMLVSAIYVVKAAFQNGEAELQIGLVKSGSAWLIDNFQFGSTEAARSFLGMKS
jgi:hypothetical protein